GDDEFEAVGQQDRHAISGGNALPRKMLSETGRVIIEIRPAEFLARANNCRFVREAVRIAFNGADEVR
ncbi:MAG TPA: hypothetical protein VK355_11685, partial [Candidatus Binatia bacterium]|nr:hypothetical protein [Candidatus Binatia bacterium]